MIVTLDQTSLECAKYLANHLETTESESSRSHKAIALILNQIYFKSGYNINYFGAEANSDIYKPDFLIKAGSRSFFILEVKSAMDPAIYKDRLLAYLITDNIKHGCLTDGILWDMFEVIKVPEKVNLELKKRYFLKEAQELVDYIVNAVDP
jgi:hypothetical protein